MIILWILIFTLFVFFAMIVLVGAPYVPTRKNDIERVFDELKLKRGDKVIDLGSGDGRVLVEAAKRGYIAKGYELNPILVLITKYRIRNYKKAEVRLADYWAADLAGCKLVFIFSAQPYMNRLTSKLNNELKRGSLAVSYGFSLPGQKITKKVGAANIYRF